MATAATVPTRMPATEQARKPGGTRSPAPLRPPAPLKASQLPIIRLAASLGDSLSSDTEKPSDRELMFVSGRRGAVITTLLQDMPHTYARRGAPAAQPDLDRTVGLISCLPRWSATEPHGASRRCRPSRSTRTPSGGGNHHPAVVGLPGQVVVAIDACNGALGHRGQSDRRREYRRIRHRQGAPGGARQPKAGRSAGEHGGVSPRSRSACWEIPALSRTSFCVNSLRVPSISLSARWP